MLFATIPMVDHLYLDETVPLTNIRRMAVNEWYQRVYISPEIEKLAIFVFASHKISV